MKLLIVSILTALLSSQFISCGGSKTSGDSKQIEDPVKFESVSIGECIKRIVYNRHGSDIEKYDSLWIEYFHELKDYTHENALKLQREIDSIVNFMRHADISDPSNYYKVLDSLKADLSPYKKSIVGYAFVHTFFDGKDTISAIFVMDTLCGFGEMTIVKDLKKDPISDHEYSEKILEGKSQ